MLMFRNKLDRRRDTFFLCFLVFIHLAVIMSRRLWGAYFSWILALMLPASASAESILTSPHSLSVELPVTATRQYEIWKYKLDHVCIAVLYFTVYWICTISSEKDRGHWSWLRIEVFKMLYFMGCPYKWGGILLSYWDRDCRVCHNLLFLFSGEYSFSWEWALLGKVGFYHKLSILML